MITDRELLVRARDDIYRSVSTHTFTQVMRDLWKDINAHLSEPRAAAQPLSCGRTAE